MATLSHSIDVFSDGSLILDGLPQLYRVLHDAELGPEWWPRDENGTPMGPIWRTNVPEVFRFEPLHTIPLNTPEWQRFTKDLNPSMTNIKWRRLFKYNTAFTNGSSGFDCPDGCPKPDYINLIDLNAPESLRFDQPRFCGGALLAGVESDGYLWFEYLDARLPPPPMDQVKLWHTFTALNVVNETSLSRFPQGDGADVIVPIIARQPVKYPLGKLEKLNMGNPLPNPYVVYRPYTG